jgi:hypothetical protein
MKLRMVRTRTGTRMRMRMNLKPQKKRRRRTKMKMTIQSPVSALRPPSVAQTSAVVSAGLVLRRSTLWLLYNSTTRPSQPPPRNLNRNRVANLGRSLNQSLHQTSSPASEEGEGEEEEEAVVSTPLPPCPPPPP